MQGWSPDFVAKLTGDAVDMGVISQHPADRRTRMPCSCSKQLAKKEGIFVGITSGGTFAGALQVCAEAPKGATILCMLPDTGERYLSTPLFADDPGRHERGRSPHLAFHPRLPSEASGVTPSALIVAAEGRRKIICSGSKNIVVWLLVRPKWPVQSPWGVHD